MKTQQFFLTGLLCLFLSINDAFAQHLSKRISLTVKDATLPQVLTKIQQKYGLRFAYLNNEIPAKTLFSAQVTDKPLAEVLDVLFDKTDMGYKESNGQIIIKKGFPKNKPKETTLKKLPAPFGETKPRPIVKTVPVPAENKPLAPAKTEPVQLVPETAVAANIPPVNSALPADESVLTPVIVEKTEAEIALEKLKNAARGIKLDFRQYTADSVIIQPAHIGFIYPLSTNGHLAPNYVNRVAFHALAGVGLGLEGVAFAGIGNLENSYANGAQFAGIFNIVRNRAIGNGLTEQLNDGFCVTGGQFAGILNSADGNVRGGQFSGFMNLNDGYLRGSQFAGFMNITRETKGTQTAGFLNMSNQTNGAMLAGFANITDEMNGAQIAGFGNVSGSGSGARIAGFMNLADSLNGSEIAGFTNISSKVSGSQVAGFINIADSVSGVQVAGFMNIAGYARGSQIGVFNFADSTSGVPIGLFSFVGKGGYNRFELYTADDFKANLAFKLGVRQFYSIIALSAQTEKEKRWAFGYGFGAEWNVSDKFKISTDLLASQVMENSYRSKENPFRGQELNLLNKLRVLGTWQIAKRFAVFGGPTYNVFVSRHKDQATGKIGSDLVTDTFYNHTNNHDTNIKMWVGFNAGLRF